MDKIINSDIYFLALAHTYLPDSHEAIDRFPLHSMFTSNLYKCIYIDIAKRLLSNPSNNGFHHQKPQTSVLAIKSHK